MYTIYEEKLIDILIIVFIISYISIIIYSNKLRAYIKRKYPIVYKNAIKKEDETLYPNKIITIMWVQPLKNIYHNIYLNEDAIRNILKKDKNARRLYHIRITMIIATIIFFILSIVLAVNLN